MMFIIGALCAYNKYMPYFKL